MSIANSRIKTVQERIRQLADALDIDAMRKDLEARKSDMQNPDFWSNNERAQRVSKESAELERDVLQIEGLMRRLGDVADMKMLLEGEVGLRASSTGDLEGNEESEKREDAGEAERLELESDLERQLEDIETDLASAELRAYLSGEYDKGSALVSVHAGAGGTDASDFAEMIARMLLKYAEQKEWSVEIIEQALAEEAGIKRMIFAVRGRYAYGYLKQEAGVHRLVRISPFDAEGMRHTSFCLVEVIPELDEVSEQSVVVPADDLRIDTFASSGAGGQSVNTTNSAVRITHLPTNTVVSVQNERSQQQNRETAMRILKSRLLQLMIQQQKNELSELRGAHIKPEWGSQIRSYVIHPYKMVKDHRTGVETQDVDAVFGGNLDAFIEGMLRLTT